MKRFFTYGVIALLCLMPATTSATPAWAKTLTRAKFGSHPVVRPLKLHYTLSWNGALKSGDLVFELNKTDQNNKKYHASHIYGGSSGIAKGLFPYKANFISYMRKDSLRPVTFVGEETDKREHMRTTNTYRKNSMTSVEEIKALNKNGKTGTEKRSFSWPNQLDAVSAMYFIRSQTLTLGEKLVFVLHPFHSPYLTEVTVKGREKHMGQNAIKLDIKMRKIGKKYVLKPYKKMKKSTLWISDDADRVPLELRSKVYIGDVRMTLKSKKAL